MAMFLCQTCGVIRRLPHWCGPENQTHDLFGSQSRLVDGVNVPIMYDVFGREVSPG